MSSLTTRRLRGRRPSADGHGSPPAAAAPRIGGARLRQVGRAALWACMALIFVRGISDVARGRGYDAKPPAAVAAAVPAADDDLRALAISFARAFLSWRPGAAREHARRVAALVAPSARRDVAVQLPRRGPGESVAESTVARIRSLGPGRALVTVACIFDKPAGRVRLLTIPVAQDPRGGIAVEGPPALAPAPPPYDGSAPATHPLTGADASVITDVVRRFMRGYLGGADPVALRYLVAQGAAIAPLRRGYSVVSIKRLSVAGTDAGSRRRLLVDVRVRDRASRAVYGLRYALAVARRDRWYVTAVDGGAA